MPPQVPSQMPTQVATQAVSDMPSGDDDTLDTLDTLTPLDTQGTEAPLEVRRTSTAPGGGGVLESAGAQLSDAAARIGDAVREAIDSIFEELGGLTGLARVALWVCLLVVIASCFSSVVRAVFR